MKINLQNRNVPVKKRDKAIAGLKTPPVTLDSFQINILIRGNILHKGINVPEEDGDKNEERDAKGSGTILDSFYSRCLVFRRHRRGTLTPQERKEEE